MLERLDWDKNQQLKICDFGSGCAHVARSFKQVLGSMVDVLCVEGNIEVAKFYPAWGLRSVTNIQDIPSQSLDLIYSIKVLEHLDDPQSVVRMLGDKLKPGGWMFITTPEGRINEGETNAYDNPAHVQFFTEKSLELLLSKTNFNHLDYVDRRCMYPKSEDLTVLKRTRRALRNTASSLKKTLKN